MSRKRRPNYSGYAQKKRQARQMTIETGRNYEVHHRWPRSRKRHYPGGHVNEIGNLTILTSEEHFWWHQLFNNMTPHEIIKRINDEFMPDCLYVQVQPRNRNNSKKAHRKRRYCTDCECEVLRNIPKVTKE